MNWSYHLFEDAGFVVRALVVRNTKMTRVRFWSHEPIFEPGESILKNWFDEIIRGVRALNLPAHVSGEGPNFRSDYLITPL